MSATTTTTIRGVSIFSRQRKRKADVFDITLSPEGIVIQRPGRAEQHMAWERVSQWEIEERPGCVVLTLRGGGSITPLMVKGWTLEDLETVLRDATESPVDAPPAPPTPPSQAAAAPAAMTEPPSAAEVAPAPDGVESAPDVPVETAETEPGEPGEPGEPAAVVPRAERRQASRRPRRPWRAAVTVALLGVLAFAVIVVLLQSAGTINWSFLGPVA